MDTNANPNANQEKVQLEFSLKQMEEVLGLLAEYRPEIEESTLDAIYNQLKKQDYFTLSKQVMPQTYSSFKTLDIIEKRFDVTVTWQSLFKDIQNIEPSLHLSHDLEIDNQPVINSEISRREGLIFPVLKEIKKKNKDKINLFSGETFEVNKDQGLTGECDYLFVGMPNTQMIKSPVFALVEAKRKTIQEGWGQCAAQMIAARDFNKQKGEKVHTIYGCVTTGELWQFAQLKENQMIIDKEKYFIESAERILGVLQHIVDSLDGNSLGK